MVAAGAPRRRNDTEYLDAGGQLDQKLLIALEVVDSARVRSREPGHRLDTLPIGDRDEFTLICAVLSKELHAQGLLLERLDPMLVEVLGIFVCSSGRRATAPDAGDGGKNAMHDAPLLQPTEQPAVDQNPSAHTPSASWRADVTPRNG
jgi:hypothetical protein